MNAFSGRLPRKGGLCLLSAILAAAGVSAAQAQQEGILTVARVDRITPKCRDHPDAPWRGRVAGNIEGLWGGYMPVSWVGCFPTRASCEAWRGPVSGIITERITQNVCEPRR